VLTLQTSQYSETVSVLMAPLALMWADRRSFASLEASVNTSWEQIKCGLKSSTLGPATEMIGAISLNGYDRIFVSCASSETP
jgi:hypothetical protein